MTYIIPLLSSNFDKKPAIIVNFILFLLIGYLYIRLNLIYLNPLWAIFGFITYRTNNEKIIISNMSYEELNKRKQTGIFGYYILNDIFVAKKEENKEVKN